MGKIEENSNYLDEAINSVRTMFLSLGIDFDELKAIHKTHLKEFRLNYLKIRKKRKYKNR